MAKYLLALYDNPAVFQKYSPDEIQQVIERYQAWGQRLGQAGWLVGGHKLRDDAGRVLKKPNGQLRIVDGPYSETKEVLGGYYLIDAPDYQTAVERIKDCPHLDFGTIELREVEEM